MPLTAYTPGDPGKYPKHEESVEFSPNLPAGAYVYVQDCSGIIWVGPDGSHMHPRLLGRARPVVAAGELTLADGGVVLVITNVSGTFCCHPDSLFTAIGGLIKQGGSCTADAIVPYEA